MKKILGIFTILISLFSTFSCVPRNVSQMGGYGDYGYLIFVGNTTKNQEVNVTVDNEPSYKAKALSQVNSNRKGQAHYIKTGKHRVVVKKGEQVIAIKDVFISSQETQIIQLP